MQESWVRAVRISSTVFFESIVYREVFPRLLSEWTQMDFVITGTYKTVAKQLHYNSFTQSQVHSPNLLSIKPPSKQIWTISPYLDWGVEIPQS